MSHRYRKLKRARYQRKLRRCQHVDHETGVRCPNDGRECYLALMDGNTAVEFFCWDHQHRAGYCRSCGGFFAGIEQFDFNPHGLCHECQDEWDSELVWLDSDDDDEEIYDY